MYLLEKNVLLLTEKVPSAKIHMRKDSQENREAKEKPVREWSDFSETALTFVQVLKNGRTYCS